MPPFSRIRRSVSSSSNVMHSQHVAGRCPKVKAALSDGEARLRGQACQARLIITRHILVRCPQFIEGSPLLAIETDILAFVLADQAVCGRGLGLGVLNA